MWARAPPLFSCPPAAVAPGHRLADRVDRGDGESHRRSLAVLGRAWYVLPDGPRPQRKRAPMSPKNAAAWTACWPWAVKTQRSALWDDPTVKNMY